MDSPNNLIVPGQVNRVGSALVNQGSDSEPPPAYLEIMVNPPAGNRPLLPQDKANPRLRTLPTANDPDALVVKFQTIVREGREIVVGRLKVTTGLPTPLEHAFILRRYDTGAISVTTMFKAAFPSGTAEEEEREMKWIKSSFDMSGMNGGRGCNAVKLAGQWVPPALALHLAPAYLLNPWINAMVAAKPEIGVAYRKSQRSQQASQVEAQRNQDDPMARIRANAQAAGLPPRPIAPMPGSTFPRPSNFPSTMQRSAPLLPTQTHEEERPNKRSRNDDLSEDEDTGVPNSYRSRGSLSPGRTTTTTTTRHVEEDGTVSITLQSVTQIRAPVGTAINAEAEIEESKATVRRIKEEALARARAGESAQEMGLVTSSPSGSRGIKRRAAETQEGVEISGGQAPVVVTTSPATGSTVLRQPEGRALAGNRRVVGAEAARVRQGLFGGLTFVGGMAVGMAAAYWAHLL